MTNKQFIIGPAVLGQSPVNAYCPRVFIKGTISVSSVELYNHL